MAQAPHQQFSSELRKELVRALDAYMRWADAEADARLQRATNHVCTEAHRLQLSADHMVIALNHLYEHLPASDDSRRHEVYDLFVAGCARTFPHFLARPL